MSRKSSVIARKAWEILRAVLRSRKGELSLNIVKLVKKVVHSTNESRRALLYGDHEFSFHDSPLVHVRMTRPPSALRFIRMPHIPCITPRPDEDEAMRSAKGEITETEDSDYEGIDERAEKFIAKFYEEMKLQRQISCR